MADQYCTKCNCIRGRRPCRSCEMLRQCEGTCDCCQGYRDELARRRAEEERNERPYLLGTSGGMLNLPLGATTSVQHFRSLSEAAGPTSHAAGSSVDVNINLPSTSTAEQNVPTATCLKHIEGCEGTCYCQNMPDVWRSPITATQNDESGAPSTDTTIVTIRMYRGVLEARIRIPSISTHQVASNPALAGNQQNLPPTCAASTGAQGVPQHGFDFVRRFPTMAEIRGVQEETLFWSRQGIIRQSPRYIYVFAMDGELCSVMCGICYLLNTCGICGGYIDSGLSNFDGYTHETRLRGCCCMASIPIPPDTVFLADSNCDTGDIPTTLDAKSISLLRTRRYAVRDEHPSELPITLATQQIICDPIEVTLHVKCEICTNHSRAASSQEDTMSFACCDTPTCQGTAHLLVIHDIQDPRPGHIPLLGRTEGSSTSAHAGTTRQRRSCDMVRQIVHSRLHVPGQNEGASTSADRTDQLAASEAARQMIRRAEVKRNDDFDLPGGATQKIVLSIGVWVSAQQSGSSISYDVRGSVDANNGDRMIEDRRGGNISGVFGGLLEMDVRTITAAQELERLSETAGSTSHAVGSSGDNWPATSTAQPNAAPATFLFHVLGCPGAACDCPETEILPRNNASGAPGTGTTIDITGMYGGVREAKIRIPSVSTLQISPSSALAGNQQLPSTSADSTETQGTFRRAGGFFTRFPTLAEIRREQEETLFAATNGTVIQLPRYMYSFTDGEVTRVICFVCYSLNLCRECGGYTDLLQSSTFCTHMRSIAVKACPCIVPSTITPVQLVRPAPGCVIRDLITTLNARSIALLRTRRYSVVGRRVEELAISPEAQQIRCDPFEVTLNVRCSNCRGVAESSQEDTMTFTCCMCGNTANLPLIHSFQDPSPQYTPLLGIAEGGSTSADAGRTHQRRSCDMVRKVSQSSSSVTGPSGGRYCEHCDCTSREVICERCQTTPCRYCRGKK